MRFQLCCLLESPPVHIVRFWPTFIPHPRAVEPSFPVVHGQFFEPVPSSHRLLFSSFTRMCCHLLPPLSMPWQNYASPPPRLAYFHARYSFLTPPSPLPRRLQDPVLLMHHHWSATDPAPPPRCPTPPPQPLFSVYE